MVSLVFFGFAQNDSLLLLLRRFPAFAFNLALLRKMLDGSTKSSGGPVCGRYPGY